jgi:spermidine synthase
MTHAWELLGSAESDEGRLELRRRGAGELVITAGGRVLMSSAAHRSETALAELACRQLDRKAQSRVLLGGLGMGFTLRAALDILPAAARVIVAEVNPVIVDWCRGPLATLNRDASVDPRVRIEIADVAAMIRAAARQGRRFDAIVLDLYEGPHAATQGREDPFYGPTALAATHAALAPDGCFAVWSEDSDAAFEKRLAAAGFRTERHRPGRGGPRHTVYLARPARGTRPPG